MRNLCFGVGLLLIAACGSSMPTAPTTDFIALDSITPTAGTTLNPGDRVTFTAVVTCTIVNSEGGSTAMVVQDQTNRSLIPAGESPPRATLSRGTTTVTLSQTVTIPESGSTVTIALPIFINESNTTRAVVIRNYPVR